jgi:hypothetical protein
MVPQTTSHRWSFPPCSPGGKCSGCFYLGFRKDKAKLCEANIYFRRVSESICLGWGMVRQLHFGNDGSGTMEIWFETKANLLLKPWGAWFCKHTKSCWILIVKFGGSCKSIQIYDLVIEKTYGKSCTALNSSQARVLMVGCGSAGCKF